MAEEFYTIYASHVSPAILTASTGQIKNILSIHNRTASSIVRIYRIGCVNNLFSGTTGGMITGNFSRLEGMIYNDVIYPINELFSTAWKPDSTVLSDVIFYSGGIPKGTEYVYRRWFWDTSYPQNRQSTQQEIRSTAGRVNYLYYNEVGGYLQPYTLRSGQLFSMTAYSQTGVARGMDVFVDFSYGVS